MRFITLAQALQHLDGILDGRFIHEHRRKTALQRAVALDVLAIFIQRGGAHTLQLAAGQGRLEHIAGIHSALRRACADDGV